MVKIRKNIDYQPMGLNRAGCVTMGLLTAVMGVALYSYYSAPKQQEPVNQSAVVSQDTYHQESTLEEELEGIVEKHQKGEALNYGNVIDNLRESIGYAHDKLGSQQSNVESIINIMDDVVYIAEKVSAVSEEENEILDKIEILALVYMAKAKKDIGDRTANYDLKTEARRHYEAALELWNDLDKSKKHVVNDDRSRPHDVPSAGYISIRLKELEKD